MTRFWSRPSSVLAPIVGLTLLVAPSSAAGQSPATATMAVADSQRSIPISIARLSSPITLDGRVNEPAWDEIAPLPMSMFSPVFLGELTEQTEVRVGYDERYLYVSGRLHDSNPAGIRTNTFYRDAYSGDDLLAVVLDSYNDYETAVWFVANPAGARSDRTVSSDAVFTGGTMPMNADWNAHWDVATSQDSTGWSVEFRIPFSTLRFQADNDRVTMGLIIYRFIARKNERQTFPTIDPKWGGLAFAKPSQAQRIVFSTVRQTKPIYVTPYTLGGVRRTSELRVGATQDRWESVVDRTGEVGLDVRYSPTSNLALDFTVNTDFAQVEADDQQINLTRFPLFFPEKRQFFQERASTFQFSTDGFVDRLFHSRRIGLAGGEIVPIYGGARAVGRIGGMDFGVLNMQTAPRGGRSSENMGVLRLNQQILNPYSSIGGMVTSRYGNDGQDNLAYGVDAVLRPVGDEWITLKWAQTFDEAITEKSATDAGFFLAQWERVRDGGLSYLATFSRVGAAYEPRLGFQARRDYRQFGGSLQYKRFQGASSPLRAVSANLSTTHYFRASDGSPESRFYQPQLQFEFKKGTELSINAQSNFDSVPQDFTIAGTTVKAGDYWYHEGQLRLMLPRSGLFRGEVNVSAGGFYDGTRVGISLAPAWNVSKHLEFGGGYEVNRIEFSKRQQEVTTHLVRLKMQVALNTRIFFNTFAQYDNVFDRAQLNGRFRYNFSEGTDLWLVFDEGMNIERDVIGQPRLPRSSGRTVLIKYTRTLTL